MLGFCTNAEAWRVMETHRIPAGFQAMCAVEGQLWCGSTSRDSVITILNSQNGEVIGSVSAPEGFCGGLTYRAGNVWYLGENRVYRMNREGEVLSVQNNPFGVMTGLAAVENGIWTIDRTDGDPSLVLFNPQGAVIRRIAIRVTDALDIHFTGTNFWITSPPNGFIHQLGADGAAVNIFPTPANTPTAVAVIDSDIYLIDNGDDHDGDILYQISPNNDPTPRILPGANLHSFGLIQVFAGATWDLSIYNLGGVDLRISQVYFGNQDQGFTLGQLPQHMVIAPGRFLLARVTFSPTSYGNKTDTLFIHSNDPVDSIATVVCHGIGVFGNRTLGMTPFEMDFGSVRADIERDGSRHFDVHLFNMSVDEVIVRNITNGIPEIFRIEAPQFPDTLFSTDTLTVRLWFTPHRAIQYIDTLTVLCSAVNPYLYGYIHGEGDGHIYEEGEVLWRSENVEEPGGDFAIGGDLNRDGTHEVLLFNGGGVVENLNGFSSEIADPIWRQTFEGINNPPRWVAEGTEMFGEVHLSSHEADDYLFASGGDNSAVYALAGEDGDLLWRWSSQSIDGGTNIASLLPGEDTDGNGTSNPLVLVTGANDNSFLVRLDGVTGRIVWYGAHEQLNGMIQLGDQNGDGLGDILLFNRNGRIITVNGANGRTIRSNMVRDFVEIEFVDGAHNNGNNLILIADSEYSLYALNPLNGEITWTIDAIEGLENLGTITCISNQVFGDSVRVAYGDENGNIVIVHDLTAGHAIGRNISQSIVTDICFAPPILPENPVSIVVGDESGNIFMSEISTLELLWTFDFIPNEGGVRRVRSFDDVDLGGSNDVIAILESGDLVCISSGGDVVTVDDPADPVPGSYSLASLYPNPFNDRVNVRVQLSRPMTVSITVYNANGQKFGTYNYGQVSAGSSLLAIDKDKLTGASGSFYLKVDFGSESTVLRGVYLK